MIVGLDHVQLAMPRGGEREARGYFVGLLGLTELEKPKPLARRGGIWLALPDGRQLHLGVEEPFRPSEKAHPAFVCAALDELARLMEDEGYTVRWDHSLAPRLRFYDADPFGNRIEFMEPAVKDTRS
jgi:catechol 2,3-dioxygenase-like lactoylglutathione lyase family enzyme